jgi:prepilin-type N-terminal cleavage/methylation domain-containing protein
MPISAVRTCSPRAHPARQLGRSSHLGSAGFTLLEISLVLVIITVVLALVLPRLQDSGHTELQAQAHRLQSMFRLLRSEAVLNGAAYRLNYDLDQQRYFITVDEPSGDIDALGMLARPSTLADPVAITDIVLPTLVGKVAQGQIYTVFYPDGSIDRTVIHLGNGREFYTVYLDLMNRLRMEPGYHEVEYSG